MEAHIMKQDDTLENLCKAFMNYKKSPKERIKPSYIQSKLESLEKLWDNFNEIHSKIVMNIKREDKLKLSYFTEDTYFKFEETYTEYKTKLKDDLKTFGLISNKNSESIIQTSCEVKLPQIKLPSFSGGYEEWQTFYDMFMSIIHNNATLSSVQKLHYLKGSLSGEPENLLKNLSTTENNYEEAWNQLTRRYNNKRYNCNEILKRLFLQRQITTESSSAIKQLLDTTSACLKSLNNLDIDTGNWDVIVNYLVISKLDNESRKQWEVQVSQTYSDELPTWTQLVQFLESRFRTLEMLDTNKYSPKSTHNTNIKYIPKQRSFHSTVQDHQREKNNACVMCSDQHLLYQCKQFAKQSPEERSSFVQSKRLCFNCLAPTHPVKSCHQATCCRRCGRRHHTLLHIERSYVQDSVPAESTSSSTTKPISSPQNQQMNQESPTRMVAHFSQEKNITEVLLATATVKAKSKNGSSYLLRALIDQGSEASFVTEDTVQSLGLKRVPTNGIVSGVGDGQTRTKSMVSFDIESICNPEFIIRVDAFILSSLTSFLPSSKTTITDWPDIETLSLADPNYGSPNKIDIILGVEVHSEILLNGLIKHPLKSSPVAQNTQLGWIISGRVRDSSSTEQKRVISLHLQVKEDELLKKFWEIENEPDSIKKRLTKEETRCEELFEATTERDCEGRYIVRLPFKTQDQDSLPEQSKNIALRRFKILEKKLLKNKTLHEDYTKVIDDYIEQEHMELLSDSQRLEGSRVVYLPHHAVIRQDKETTKVRVVFDASSKGVNNMCLNDNFMVGPKLQQDLRHILMRWRLHPICLVADLIQMYRQIKVHCQDTDCQRVLWRSNPEIPIDHYRISRLTFGTACAPYLAVKCLQQLAKDNQTVYPMAAKVTLQDFYMDDLLTGCDTEDEAVEIYDQINKLMNSGGFHLQKWCTNSKKLLDYIIKERQRSNQSLNFKIDNMIKVLGICWNKITDNFEYTLQLSDSDQPITKRKVLSEIARIYDPMGWIAPIIINAKIIIQNLWKSDLNWDDTLTEKLKEEWLDFRNDLTNAKNILIPRWLQTRVGHKVELHAFADASQSAYAAAVYLKVVDDSSNIHVFLITAKTKVAPIQREITIPRLELCAALLAAKLLFEVAQVMSVSKENWFAWSDSTVVLAWLKGEPRRWTTFVSNRVSEILNIIDYDQWGYVATNENPADCASRGVSTLTLINHALWWYGPEWLRQNRNYNVKDVSNFTTHEEERPIKTLTAIIEIEEKFIWNRFSSLTKMLRVLAYCRKFLNLKLTKEQRVLSKEISKEEIEIILKVAIKETQNLYFKDEIKQLRSQGVVLKKSKLHTLYPILDENGILRVGGRINQAKVQFDKRHPVILPSDSHLTKLIIQDAHFKTLHGGPQIMLNYLRSKFWIIRARDKVKKCYRNCITCLRYARQNMNQLMGQLPEVRIKPSKPFKASGVDFTGHINIRFSPGRGSKSYKGYVCLFICMSTKAIHLEAVSDLTAQGFIAAFRRFVSRRGHCQDLYSDNGTGFVGADRELREMFTKATSELPKEIGQLLVNEGTTWHFIPPHAPNFGGLWEAGIRSAKAHLKRVIGEATLTFEELSTVLTQIEACLNSRPLSQLSDNLDDPLPLTPGHFLVGEPLITIPDKDYSKMDLTGLQRWKLTQKMVNHFWRKWSEEYLVTLNQRTKWTMKRSEPEIDDIVIIKDSNTPPAKWLLGRVIEKHPGKDSITRVVTVKTKNGSFKRPCNKICFLPK